MVQAREASKARGVDAEMMLEHAVRRESQPNNEPDGDSSTAAPDASADVSAGSAVSASASTSQPPRRRASRRRRDPFTPVLNMHAPHSRLPGRRSRSSLLGASGPSQSQTALSSSLSSDDGAARLPYAYTAHRSSRYNVKGADATPTTGAHASALGSTAGEEWLMDSATQLAAWAAGVEEEQDHRRQVRVPSS